MLTYVQMCEIRIQLKIVIYNDLNVKQKCVFKKYEWMKTHKK